MADVAQAPLPGTVSRILREPRAVVGGLFILFLIFCAIVIILITTAWRVWREWRPVDRRSQSKKASHAFAKRIARRRTRHFAERIRTQRRRRTYDHQEPRWS